MRFSNRSLECVACGGRLPASPFAAVSFQFAAPIDAMTAVLRWCCRPCRWTPPAILIAAAKRAEAASPMLLRRSLLQRHSVLPGFDLALGFTLLYLSLIVLIPLSAAFLKTFTLTLARVLGRP